MALRIPYVVSRLVIGFTIALSVLTPALSAQEESALVLWVDEALASALEPAATQFERDTGMRVVFEVYESRELVRDHFYAEVSSPDGPDIIALSDNWIYGLVKSDLAPIDLGPKAGEFLPLTLRGFMHGDHLYGVPYNVSNLALVRNPELVPEPPKTWDEVLKLSVVLRESGVVEHGLVLNDYNAYHFLPVITAYGGYVFGTNADGSWNFHDVGLNNAGAIQALEWLAAISQAGALDTGLDWEAAHAAFEQGRAAMIITGPWAYWRFGEAGIPYVVDPLPAGTQPAHPFVHLEGFQINAHGDNIDAAQQFLVEYVVNTETMLRLADHVAGFSPHEEAFSLMTDPHELGWALAASNGQLFPGPLMDSLWDPLTGAIEAVWLGERTPADALKEAGEQFLSAVN